MFRERLHRVFSLETRQMRYVTIEVCKIVNGLEKAKKEFAISHGMSFSHRLWSSVTRDVIDTKRMNGFKIEFDNLMKEASTQDCFGLLGVFELVDF